MLFQGKKFQQVKKKLELLNKILIHNFYNHHKKYWQKIFFLQMIVEKLFIKKINYLHIKAASS